jgi:hypothetical protein
MADSTIKQVTVSAEAASSIGGTRKRRRRATAGETSKAPRIEKDGHKGGGSPGTVVQVEASKPPASAPAPTAVVQRSEASELRAQPIASTPAPAKGGAVKVILEKSKKKTRVLLAPAKIRKLPGLPGAPVAKPEKTRKVAKKVRMSLTGFGKRVGRAQTIRHEAKKETFEQVKKHLVEAKLIKPDSKAPEGVLRQMYADYMMLKKRAL